MSDIKAFEFATKRAKGDQIAGAFTINGEQFDVRVMKDAHIAYLIAAVNDGSDPMKVVSKVLDFTEKAMTKESARRFEKLVLDPDEGLEIAQIVEIFQHILGLVAAGNPTGEPSASSPTRSRTGTASRAKRPSAASTR